MRLGGGRGLLARGSQLGGAGVRGEHGSQLGLRGGFGLLGGSTRRDGGVQLGFALGHSGLRGDQGGVRGGFGAGSGSDNLSGFGDLGQSGFLILGTQGIQRAFGYRGSGSEFVGLGLFGGVSAGVQLRGLGGHLGFLEGGQSSFHLSVYSL